MRTSFERHLLGETSTVIEEALEALAEKQVATVFLGLSQERQQDVAVLSRHMVGAKQLEGVGEVDHLGDRWRLFERVIAKGQRDASHLTVKLCVGVRRATRDDLRFALRCWVLDADVKTAPADWITEPSLFVAGQHNKWNGAGFNCPKLGYR